MTVNLPLGDRVFKSMCKCKCSMYLMFEQTSGFSRTVTLLSGPISTGLVKTLVGVVHFSCLGTVFQSKKRLKLIIKFYVSNSTITFGHSGHLSRIHEAKSESVREFESYSILTPISGLEISLRSGSSDCQMLNVSPGQVWISFQCKGNNASGHWRTGTGSSMLENKPK